ncbi:MAG: heparan-alpha-glucosaminide N-acetyltransferase domain-containing protein [Acidobacteriaceae bacterium]
MAKPGGHLDSAVQPNKPRLQSIDALRGAAMVLMAIDHVREYFDYRALQFSPTDLSHSDIALFLTRWITHFCAPIFIFTAGIGARLWMMRGGHSKAELARFLAIRGLFLIVLEPTFLRLIMFSQISLHRNPVGLLILWAIGVSMIALAALSYLPMPVLAALGVAVIALHNLLDGISAGQLGSLDWAWYLLHQQGIFSLFGIRFLAAYPVLPWIGVICSGFCLGGIFSWEAKRRQRLLLIMGFAVTAGFVILRVVNLYGDPAPWSGQASPAFTILSFLNVTKYPPSLDFLSMTLGPSLIALALLERRTFSVRNPLIVFGRVPLFYYVTHLAVAHLFYWFAHSFLFATPNGYPLWVTYLVWVIVVALLYPACVWYGRLKQRRHKEWLSAIG